MPSYTQYKRQITVFDADDNEIESWITVRGNHIPIKKGQSKEEAVKAFVESKKGNSTNTNKESKYSPEFEVVRKNALANSSVYGGKYTQKSKAEAYKEYKNDTSSKENMKKANEFVNSEHVDKKWSGWGMNKNKQTFSIKGGRVVVDPKLKTANWYNSQGALTLKQKDLDVDKFVEHGVNNLGWQKMSGKEESALKEFQKIANKPEYKGEEKPEAGFVPAPKGSKLRTKAEIEKSVNEYFEEYGVEEAKEWRKVKNNMWEHGVTHETIEDIINSGKYNPDDILEALADRSHNKIDAMVKATKKKSEDGCDVKKRWSADWKKK